MNKLSNGIGLFFIMILNLICAFSINKQNLSDMNLIIVGVSLGMFLINIIEYINERRK